MRAIPPDLAARLSMSATSLCHCWSLTRRDGFALGFTDHDRDLTFGGLTYAARTGLEAAEASAELGFAVGGGDVAGAALWSKCTKGVGERPAISLECCGLRPLSRGIACGAHCR